VKVHVQREAVSVRDMVRGGSRGIDPLILDLGAGWSEVLNSAALPRGKGNRYPVNGKLGGSRGGLDVSERRNVSRTSWVSKRDFSVA
jgi:hypothetical protein